ncbi:MAG: methylmalonyl-CoA mutase, partial [Gemmatimonadota bacterium]|nr:methylmalonyl-CoA mutase [Gemmatimonadota bacterium]
VERGETVVVGVNRYGDGAEPPVIPAPDYSGLARAQIARLAESRSRRDGAAVAGTLAAVTAAARRYLPSGGGGGGGGERAPLMPLIIDAVRARASVGEIADALRAAWGEYRPA